MKLMKGKKLAFATTLSMIMSTAVVNATSTLEAQQISRGLGDWIIIIAEILSLLCLIVFAIYMGKYITIKPNKDAEADEKVVHGVRNGMMTMLIGIAICQAAMVVAKLCF